MTSLSALRNRLDMQVERTQRQSDGIAMKIASTRPEGVELFDDLHAFNKALRQSAAAHFCQGQDTRIKHSLAKAIIDETR